MTDRAELIAELEWAKLPHRHSNGGWCRSEWAHVPPELRTCDCPAGSLNAVLDKAIAALEAKPEPAKPLPESVDAWINSHAESVSDYSKTWWIKESDIRAYIASLHSQHQAELAAKDAEIAKLRSVAQGAFDVLNSADEIKEQGRREALQTVPVEALVFADDTMESEWINTIEDAEAGRIAAYRDDIKKLIESAREEAACHTEPAQEKT